MSAPPPLELAHRLAQRGRLYPGVIVHGGDDTSRRSAALLLAQALLCIADVDTRPCGTCRHCRRVQLPASEDDRKSDVAFHPDLIVVERDLRTSTSAEAVRTALRSVQQSPFEARGQVVVVTAAESLSGAAANALLKSLEEPGTGAPRHFLLLCPAAQQLLPTLRSRSLALYLGPSPVASEEHQQLDELRDELTSALDLYLEQRSGLVLMGIASLVQARVGAVATWDDPRSETPWGLAAAAFARLAVERSGSPESRGLLELAQALLDAPEMRLRAVSPRRLLEGELTRCLA